MDMLHAATDASRVVRFLLGVIEDGGEMILMSAIAGYAFLLNGRQGDTGFSLRRFVAASRFRRARPAPGASDSIRVPA